MKPNRIESDYAESLAILRLDPHLRPLIRAHGAPQIVMRGQSSRMKIFDALLRSIIYQQLSGKAANAILGRFKQLYGGRFPLPDELLATPDEKLRSAGLSGAKARYLKDAADKFVSGVIKHRTLSRMESDAVIEHLVQIQGVGVWTAQMLLLFTLGRLDILPVGDLGVKKGFQKAYGLDHLPSAAEMEALARPWRAHASVAAWYLWRAADSK